MEEVVEERVYQLRQGARRLETRTANEYRVALEAFMADKKVDLWEDEDGVYHTCYPNDPIGCTTAGALTDFVVDAMNEFVNSFGTGGFDVTIKIHECRD